MDPSQGPDSASESRIGTGGERLTPTQRPEDATVDVPDVSRGSPDERSAAQEDSQHNQELEGQGLARRPGRGEDEISGEDMSKSQSSSLGDNSQKDELPSGSPMPLGAQASSSAKEGGDDQDGEGADREDKGADQTSSKRKLYNIADIKRSESLSSSGSSGSRPRAYHSMSPTPVTATATAGRRHRQLSEDSKGPEPPPVPFWRDDSQRTTSTSLNASRSSSGYVAEATTVREDPLPTMRPLPPSVTVMNAQTYQLFYGSSSLSRQLGQVPPSQLFQGAGNTRNELAEEGSNHDDDDDDDDDTDHSNAVEATPANGPCTHVLVCLQGQTGFLILAVAIIVVLVLTLGICLMGNRC